MKKTLSIAVFLWLLFIMTYNLLYSAPWGDEWIEYTYSQASFQNGEFYESVISTFQPPLYNFIMHFWLKINTSVLWFRLFNLIPGILSGLFLYKTIQMLYHQQLAILAVFLLSISYQWIYYIQECSEYTLMLMFLFASIYFYILSLEKFTIPNVIAFTLMCVGAIYSQYGSIFIVLPLLLFFYFTILFSKKKTHILQTTLIYFGNLLLFAIPLYYFFIRVQLSQNGSEEIPITIQHIKEFPTTLGVIIGYLFHLNTSDFLIHLLQIFSIFFIGLNIFFLFKKPFEWQKASLVFTLFVAYTLHYYLVIKHIYAMIHPGLSGGFYFRYSNFYLPLVCILLPMIFYETILRFRQRILQHLFASGVIFLFLCVVSISLPAILKNWKKSYDDDFAKIWVSHQGYHEITYIIGVASYGFHYYVSEILQDMENTIDYTKHVHSSLEIDLENLPDTFWLWRTNWGGDAYGTTLEAAQTQGYQIEVFIDEDYYGQLARCVKP